MFGFREGDRLLQGAATMIADAIPPKSAFLRRGGDEFLILLPGADLEAALATAQALVEGARRLGAPRRGWFESMGPSLKVGAVAVPPGSKRSATGLHRAVDAVAHLAVAEGRDIALGATRVTEDSDELAAHLVTPLDPARPGRSFRRPVRSVGVRASVQVPASAWSDAPKPPQRLAGWLDELATDDGAAFSSALASKEAHRRAVDAAKRELLGRLFDHPGRPRSG